MTMLRFDPFRGFEHSMRKMQDFAKDLSEGVSIETGNFKPRVDISEDSANVYVYAEMPGMIKENIKVNISEDNTLVIKGEKKPAIPENATLQRTERGFGLFERQFLLPENLEIDKISAKYENGVLELVIPKKEPVKPKEVDVKIL